MNIRATIAAALVSGLLLAGVAAPAHAEEVPPEPAPATCEETVQQYRDKAALLSYSLQIQIAETGRLNAQVETLTDTVEHLRAQGVLGSAVFEVKHGEYQRLYLRYVKLQSKMTKLRAKVRYLQENR